MLDTFVSGAAFGAALTATGMYQPAVILAQMKLQNWQMVQTFLTASGASTLLVTLCQKLGYISLKPRGFSSLGLFGPLDGNILGGCLLGIGMTLSGSCPGTVFAQVGTGVTSGLYTLAGAVLGGIIWSNALRSLFASLKAKAAAARQSTPPATTTTTTKDQAILTVYKALGTSLESTALAVGAAFAGVVAAISALDLVKTKGLVGPLAGGLLIASAQTLSALTRKTLLGTSGSFEEVGDYLAWLVSGGGRANKGGPGTTTNNKGANLRPSSTTITVVTGMIFGSLALSLACGPLPQMLPVAHLRPARLVAGGVLMAVGSRLGGGCTSGHGISGISLLSLSSFVTVAAMFAGAMATATIV
ncbi:hypothetical protein F5Y17DRAFT_125871 [Xylariaceae sp. FL0594]|nr:hypothetical protein F5Y17DRAFT_125871 [Xylariaceae sp. FL0594]